MREDEAKVNGGKGLNPLKGPELSDLNLARRFVSGVYWLCMAAQIGQLTVTGLSNETKSKA